VIRDELFERLRQLRKRFADELNVPPFVVFSDATLSDMAEKRPINRIQMLQVSGVGEAKVAHYGEAFINEILNYAREKTAPGTRVVNGMTYVETYEMYKKGLSPTEIARRRNLNELTIYSHLAKLYEDGYEIDVWQYLTKSEYRAITEAAEQLQILPGAALKPLFEHLEGHYEYYKLRVALAIWGKQGL
jgi:ATP-dependent DNA helicase RecQ